MKQIAHIIKYKILTFLKLNPINTSGDFLKSFGSVIVYSGFAIGTFFFSKSVINYLLVEMKIGLFLLHEFLSIILFIFFLSVNVGNIIVSYSTLYKSGEIDFLLTKPISPLKIFVIKFLDNFFYSSSTLLLIIFSSFLGYGIYFKIDLLTIFSVVLFNFLPFMFTAAAIGVIILLLVMKLASKINFKYIIYGLIIFYLTSLITFFKISSPVKLVNSVMEYYPNVDQYFGQLIPPITKLLPNHWLSESLYWIVLNHSDRAFPYFIFQVLSSVILFSIAVMIGRKWYYKTWLSSFNLRNGQKKRQNHNTSLFDFENKSAIKSQTEMILKKEYKLFFREPSQVIHLSLLLILITIFIFSLKGLSLLGTRITELQTIIYLSVFLFNILFVSTLSLRFVFPIISLEGESFWKIKTSPINVVKAMRIKLMVYIIPIFIISQILSFFSNRKFSSDLILIAGIISAFSTIVLVMLNFGMGGIFANFKERNPIRISSSQGASIAFLLNIVYMIFLVSVMLIPISKYFEAVKNYLVPDLTNMIISVSIIGVTSILISFLFYRLCIKSLSRDF
ncbi:MAG: hypothetical protein NTX22_12605 [Ignavibacteriales bacterium]|nr:hypothetical protein [Ignavibacteriales bacterium]